MLAFDVADMFGWISTLNKKGSIVVKDNKDYSG